jgi:hypothetical protein
MKKENNEEKIHEEKIHEEIKERNNMNKNILPVN